MKPFCLTLILIAECAAYKICGSIKILKIKLVDTSTHSKQANTCIDSTILFFFPSRSRRDNSLKQSYRDCSASPWSSPLHLVTSYSEALTAEGFPWSSPRLASLMAWGSPPACGVRSSPWPVDLRLRCLYVRPSGLLLLLHLEALLVRHFGLISNASRTTIFIIIFRRLDSTAWTFLLG